MGGGDWPMWRLEHYAAIEHALYGRRYMAASLLVEAVWFGLNYGPRVKHG